MSSDPAAPGDDRRSGEHEAEGPLPGPAAGDRTLPPLVTGLIDDAAMFPPGNAAPGRAVLDHLRHRAAWYATAIGPLLVPAARWAEFTEAWELAGAPELTVTVIGTCERPDPLPAGLTVAGFELLAGTPAPLPQQPAGTSLAVEFPAHAWEVPAAVAATADPRVVGKFRTGGTTASAFPDERTLAEVVHRTVALGAPMKYTAGLHHAIRHTDPATGFEHHGFLNLLLATVIARRGGDIEAVTAALADRDPTRTADRVRGLTDDEISDARASFTSFGCCGVTDPIDDLTALGLLAGEDL